MPTNLQALNNQKEKILSTIRLKGPCLPAQIARTISVDPLFASAFLSELKAEQKLKVSNMKVGSSPLYFLPGQENQLENHIQHLNNREREAFSQLKEKQILQDESLSPVSRVALRSLKDFAVPIRIRGDQEIKLFWKHFLLPEHEVKSTIQKITSTEEPQQVQKPVQTPVQTTVQTPEPKKHTPQIQTEIVQPKITQPTQTTKSTAAPITTKQNPRIINSPSIEISPSQKPPKEYEFSKAIQSYLQAKDIELLSVLAEKKREFTAKVRIDTLFGKQSLYLIAKDKKNITDNDLTLALQKAQAEKMTALIISPGELNKKAKEHLSQWNNLIKYEQLKI